jgi:hypothetical protein
VLDSYEALGSHVPLTRKYREKFDKYPVMKRCLCLMYKDVLVFQLRLLKLFEPRSEHFPGRGRDSVGDSNSLFFTQLGAKLSKPIGKNTTKTNPSRHYCRFLLSTGCSWTQSQTAIASVYMNIIAVRGFCVMYIDASMTTSSIFKITETSS